MTRVVTVTIDTAADSFAYDYRQVAVTPQLGGLSHFNLGYVSMLYNVLYSCQYPESSVIPQSITVPLFNVYVSGGVLSTAYEIPRLNNPRVLTGVEPELGSTAKRIDSRRMECSDLTDGFYRVLYVKADWDFRLLNGPQFVDLLSTWEDGTSLYDNLKSKLDKFDSILPLCSMRYPKTGKFLYAYYDPNISTENEATLQLHTNAELPRGLHPWWSCSG